MTADQFNDKYSDYLEEGHYGLDVNIPEIVEFLDGIFRDITQIPGFKYSQIKIKFGYGRFYSTLYTPLRFAIESEITKLANKKD